MIALRRLSLVAGLALLSPALAQDPKPTAALQTEFNGFIKTFRAAMKANDAAAVAKMTRLPFETESGPRTAEQFQATAYRSLFTSKNRACIQRAKAVYSRDGLNNDNYFIFCGELIFVFTKTPAGFLFTETGMND